MYAFARRGGEEWPIAEVPKSELSFAPDGKRFVYARPPKIAGDKVHRMIVRDIAGEPVNEFPLYRAGKPENVTWLDDRRVGYVAPPVPEQKLPAAYVVHDIQSGEVLRARSGSFKIAFTAATVSASRMASQAAGPTTSPRWRRRPALRGDWRTTRRLVVLHVLFFEPLAYLGVALVQRAGYAQPDLRVAVGDVRLDLVRQVLSVGAREGQAAGVAVKRHLRLGDLIEVELPRLYVGGELDVRVLRPVRAPLRHLSPSPRP